MSLFFVLRSLYAYCRAFSTRSLATLMQFFPLPLKPLARLRTCRMQGAFKHHSPEQLHPELLGSPVYVYIGDPWCPQASKWQLTLSLCMY